MQKQKKQLMGVVVVLIICLAAYFGLVKYNDAQEEKEAKEAEEATIHVTDFAEEDITAFSYVLDGTTVSFTKDGDGNWTYDEDTSIDIDEDSISSLLGNILDITAEEELTEVDDTVDYGFESPTQTITITTGEGTTTLTLGAENAINSNYYLKTSADDTIYLVGSTLSSAFSKTIEDLTAEETQTEDEGDTE